MEPVLKPNIYKIVVKEENPKELKGEEEIIEYNLVHNGEDETEVTIYIESSSDQARTDLGSVLCDGYTENLDSDVTQNLNKNYLNSMIQKYTEDNFENINIQEESNYKAEPEHDLNDHWRSQLSLSLKCIECNILLTSEEKLKKHMKIHKLGDNIEKSFTCSDSGCSSKNFASKELMEKHLRTHNIEPSETYGYYDCSDSSGIQSSFNLHKHSEYLNYACNICDYQSTNKTKLYEHMWGHSQHNIPIFPCDICGKKFSDVMMKSHQLEHKYNNSLICTECGAKLSNFIKLDKHMKDHTSNSKEISCIFCDSTFQFRAEYNKHMEFFHIDKYGTISPAINLVPNFCTCQICFKIFPQKSGLNEHMKIHSEEKRCPKCSYTSKIKAQLEIHIASLCDTVQAFKCKECGKQFSSKPFLKRHMIIHSTEKPYECTECHFKSSHSQSLRSHLRKVHNKRDEDIYQFRCSECEKMFASVGELQLHIENKKCEFKCLHCTFVCRSSKEIKKHRKNRHYTKRNIVCPECPRKFQSNWQLEKHITAIHDGEKPFLCNHCNKSFGFKASLQKHLKTLHKDSICYKCEECDYKTATEHNLEVHIVRKHGDIPLFHCSHCDFKCKSHYILKKHIVAEHPNTNDTSKKIMSENVFQCPDCDKPFNNRIMLKEHYVLEHL